MPRPAGLSVLVWSGVAAAFLFCACLAATPAHDFASYRPSAKAVRIDSSRVPKIDGDLSDPAWREAAPISEFYQIDPKEGAPATERTEIRILYDERNFYLAVTACDRNPAGIVARIKQRDGALDYDDYVRIYLDPGLTGRNGYIFEVNPLGARRDGLLQNNASVLYEWNSIWSARTSRSGCGWTAEIAIPFRNLAYGKNPNWGFDVLRMIRRKAETDRWSSINRAVLTTDISREGTLSGISDIGAGIGLDVQAFALGRYQNHWNGKDGTGFSLRPSANVFYKITPALTGTLTLNTDFSDAPLDDRQVNTTRFSLFYPERRDFFLQDASAFEFGGMNLTINTSGAGDYNGMPFLSRRIGIVNGGPVNILGGAKLSGSVGDTGIGALSVLTAGSGGIGEQLLSVVRATVPVMPESKLGFIVTNGDPTGASDNTVAGTDFQFHKSNLFGDKNLVGDVFYERSFSDKTGNGDSFGGYIGFPNEPWSSYLGFKQVGSNFNPALGFVSRPATRLYDAGITYRERYADASVRSWSLIPTANVTTGLDNVVQSVSSGIMVTVMDSDNDFYSVQYLYGYEHPLVPFALPHGIIVPAGQYENHQFLYWFSTSTARPISAIIKGTYSGFYGGTLLRTDSSLNITPNETLTLTMAHCMNQISVPNGNVVTHVESLDGSVNFTPDMQLRAQLQYDNISRNFAMSLRYRWEFEPGAEVLAVIGEDATMRDFDYRSQVSSFSLRLGKTFRF